ncbi:hypothetical protein KFE25_010835 [Diacronema lutheri]|uniref:CobW C-terminal domain-containing protein n=2 Tax=Diacronema lutheri TaxID=2081491 RepID=A0A8J5XL19_DIALT|nr:hypothetical protein KFE25_010835 [Diacronema lutheri]
MSSRAKTRCFASLAALAGAAAVHGTARPSAFARVRALSGGAGGGISASAAAPSAALDPEKWLARQRDFPVPVTIISGFLGAGKTTLLKHVLENGDGCRVGVLVNDVAAVNIDAKLVAQRGAAGGPATATAAGALPATAARTPLEMDMVQLQNGCICCSAGDEMFGALGELISLSYMKGARYDHVVVEASGVAEPRLVRDAFQEADAAGYQVMQAVRLARMVTVVDASTFAEQLNSIQKLRDRPELLDDGGGGAAGAGAGDGAAPLAPFAPVASPADPAANRAIVDLLVEQVETADVVVLNKLDCVSAQQAALVRSLVLELNGYAHVVDATYGRVALEEVLPAGYSIAEVQARAPQPETVAQSNEVMDHKAAIDLALQKHRSATDGGSAEPAHTSVGHAHEHDVAGTAAGAEPAHGEPGHVCAGSDCGHEHAHASHGHAHEHDAAGTAAGANPAHGEPGHVCAGSDCGHEHAHASHGHAHEHDAGGGETTASARFGIKSFVYARRRPFERARLTALFDELTRVQREEAAAGRMPNARETPSASADADAGGRSAVWAAVLRSKGFVWLADAEPSAHYWSHARVHGELGELGQWWAAVPRDTWPREFVESILTDFDAPSKAAVLRELDGEGARSGGAALERVGVGDRRQELVFIGVGLDEAAISAALDECLVDVPAGIGLA